RPLAAFAKSVIEQLSRIRHPDVVKKVRAAPTLAKQVFKTSRLNKRWLELELRLAIADFFPDDIAESISHRIKRRPHHATLRPALKESLISALGAFPLANVDVAFAHDPAG